MFVYINVIQRTFINISVIYEDLTTLYFELINILFDLCKFPTS
jgi:hypothetical protein